MENYNFKLVEKKWQEYWEKNNSFYFDISDKKPKFYELAMFPYPSGELHVGHLRNFVIGDVLARFKRMQGYNVLNPMGADSFGLPAENAAIKKKILPSEHIKNNIEIFIKSMKLLGLSYDYSRFIETSSIKYYGKQQQLFLKLLEKGLAYQKESFVNWDPIDQTVLANEQVIDGKGWRSSAIVEKKKLKQWFFKITQYAEELLNDIDNKLQNWPEKVKLMQKNWIGKSEGALVNFNISNTDKNITVYTTRPDTLFGASFIGLSSNHPFVEKIAKNNVEIQNFVKECQKTSIDEETLNTMEKKGINLNITVDHPFDKNIKLPIFVANFILIDYGTGAIFGCPAHDERDYEFATKYNLSITQVVKQKDIIFETERLSFKKVDINNNENIDFFVSLYNDKNLMKFVGFPDGLHTTFEKEKQLILQTQNTLDERILCYVKNTNECIGYYKIGEIKDNKNKIDYKIKPKFWNKGFGYEIMLNLINYIFNGLNLNTKVQASPNIENQAFIKILKKCNFKDLNISKKNKDTNNKEFICKIYEISKEDWKKNSFNYNILPFTEDGININSNFLNNLTTIEAKNKAIEKIQELKIGEKKVNYRIRDWSFSRQRYWGCPIPVVYCDTCGIVAEKEENLPIKLPEDVIIDGKGNPLEKHQTWKYTKCPKCGKEAIRETDTMDTFVDSSWYFLRYLDINENKAFNSKKCNEIMPIDQYVGGIEHATGHLIYARFFTKALRDCNLLKIDEPIKSLFNQGMVCHKAYKGKVTKDWCYPWDIIEKDNKFYNIHTNEELDYEGIIKMSKSKSNVVDNLRVVNIYGADSARMFVMSDSPAEKDFEWTDQGIEGCWKYINRMHKLISSFNIDINLEKVSNYTNEIIKMTHKTIKYVTENIEKMEFNKAIARIRELTNFLEKIKLNSQEDKESFYFALINFVKLFNPFAPHFSSEMLEKLQFKDNSWPNFDEKLTIDEIVTLAIQVNGKLRGTIDVNKNLQKDEIELFAKKDGNVAKYLDDKEIKKVIIVADKLINFVV